MKSVKSIFFTLILYIIAVSGDMLLLKSNHLDITALTPCENDTDCEDIENSTCVNNMCSCGGTNICTDKTKLVVMKIGETCTNDNDCNIENSYCKIGKCSCFGNKVVSEDQRNCLPIATGLGSTCKETVQCQTVVPHSICQNDKCACEEQMHQYNESCYGNVGLGQECNNQGDCSATTFAECLGGKCMCRDGYVRSSTSKCLEIATKIDAPCYEDIQCSKFGKADCKTGHCRCMELYNFKLSKNICVRDMLLGETCMEHTDCHGIESGESRLECVLGECKCHSNYVELHGYCTSGSLRFSNIFRGSLLSLCSLYFLVFHSTNIFI